MWIRGETGCVHILIIYSVIFTHEKQGYGWKGERNTQEINLSLLHGCIKVFRNSRIL